MSLLEGLQLPFGIQPTVPSPVNTWEGPYVSISEALSSIPIDVRYPTMEVRVLDEINGNKKYWFKDGIEDGDLIEFGVGESFVTGLTESLNAKFDKTGGTITGNVVIESGYTISGDGSGLTNIPSSAISVSTIQLGSNTAEMTENGLVINTGVTIDGPLVSVGSTEMVAGLNSQYLSGKTASDFALSNHIHSQYSQTGHTHVGLYNPTGGTSPIIYVDNGGNVHIDGDIIQQGTGYTTSTEQIISTSDYIYLRSGSTSSLNNNEYAGFEIINYDGVNNGRLAFDKNGWARVGDVDNEQPLATREETPTNNYLAMWNSGTTRFETIDPLTLPVSTSVGDLISDEIFNRVSGDTNLYNLIAGVTEMKFDKTGGTISGNINIPSGYTITGDGSGIYNIPTTGVTTNNTITGDGTILNPLSVNFSSSVLDKYVFTIELLTGTTNSIIVITNVETGLSFKHTPTDIPEFTGANEMFVEGNTIWIIYKWNSDAGTITNRIVRLENVIVNDANNKIYYNVGQIQVLSSGGVNMVNIHGTDMSETHIFGACRLSPTRICRINKWDFNDLEVVQLPSGYNGGETLKYYDGFVYLLVTSVNYTERLKIAKINANNLTSYSLIVNKTSGALCSPSPIFIHKGTIVLTETWGNTNYIYKYSLNGTLILLRTFVTNAGTSNTSHGGVIIGDYLYLTFNYGTLRIGKIRLSDLTMVLSNTTLVTSFTDDICVGKDGYIYGATEYVTHPSWPSIPQLYKINPTDLSYTIFDLYNANSTVFVTASSYGTKLEKLNALNISNWDGTMYTNATVYGQITSTKFITSGGTSSQFIKGDGSLDGNKYSLTGHTHSNLVPYTGSTQDVDLGNHTISIDGVRIDTATPYVVQNPGDIGWNSVDGTFNMKLLNGTTLQAGQELHFYGKAQGTINNRDVVQFAGVQGDHFLIKVAVPSEIDANPEYLMGIATDNISNGGFGYVTAFGKINNVYTSGWTLESPRLYFDFVSGGMTNTQPQAPTRRITLASVIKLSTGGSENGIIFVRPTFGCRLTDLDDVNGTPLSTNGQIMVWDNDRQVFDFTDNINDYLSLTGGTINGYVTASGFTGDGSGLTNIPASGVTGLNLDRITSGNNSAIMSPSGLTINTNMNINGDIIQNGSIWETHVNQVYSSGDTITLRDGAINALPTNGYTGIIAKKYDGNNDGVLVFDLDGVARVGDMDVINWTGTTQAIATREDSPLNEGIAYWDSASKKFNTKVLTVSDISDINSFSGTTIGPAEDGDYSDGIFTDFTPSTKVGVAIDRFNEMFKLLAPTPPSDWTSGTMTIGGPSYSARSLSSGAAVTITTNTTPIFTMSVPSNGLSEVVSGATLSFNLNGSAAQETVSFYGTPIKNSGVIRYVYGDPYAGQSGKAGFWVGFTSASAVSTALTPSSTQKTANFMHSTKGTESTSFYLDSPLTVGIGTISATVPSMGGHVSGVKTMTFGQSITGIGFSITNVSSYFYAASSVWAINAGLVAGQTGDPSSIPTSNGSIGSVSNATTTILNSQYSESLSFTIKGRNSIGTYGSNTTFSDVTKRVDTVSIETERLTSGSGNYPASFGSVFDSTQSLVDTYTSELQLINGKYKWLSGDYSAFGSPNYSGVSTGDDIDGTHYRWATFNVGTKSSAVNNITITIPSATIGSSWGAIKMYVKIGASGWLDATMPQSVAAPYVDGDAALNVASSTAYNVRVVTFGTVPRSGDVYVRIGIKATDTSFTFKKPTMI